MTNTIYRLDSDGKYKAPGLPDVLPGGKITPPAPSSVLKFGTTVCGQSYARYKEPTISSEADRHRAVEYDTKHITTDGTVIRGSGLARHYNDRIGLWSNTKYSYLRNGAPMIYSFKAGSESESVFKADIRAWLDSKPPTSEFVWLTFWHEPDDDIYGTAQSMTLDYWITRNRWVREVLDEPAYASRTDIRFGPIFTGTPWNKGTKPESPRSWKSFYTAMNASRGGNDTWDFMGGDRYNPGWDGPNHYVEPAEWFLRKDQFHAETGLPMVIGEGGSARVFGSYTEGKSYAQLDNDRAAYMTRLLTAVLERGYIDAFSWWRVPAVKLNGYPSVYQNPFSTIMITPNGYDAVTAAAGKPGPPGGYDAQVVVDVWSKFCAESMIAAEIPFYTGGMP